MTSSGSRSGILFVVSAPSGTGKSSVSRKLLEQDRGLEFSVSYTTRAPREQEADGREYHFVEREAFQRMIDAGEFLEWAEVFDERYGTGLDATRRALARGRDVLLDIDVQGARQVCRGPLPTVSVMLLPPAFDTLEQRLRGRDSEPESARVKRLARARGEAEAYTEFDYVVINDDLQPAVDAIACIVRAERSRTQRRDGDVQRVIATFPAD